MSKQPPPTAAASAAAASPNDHLSGVDIGKVMGSTGPTVNCVLLRVLPSNKNGKATMSSASTTATAIDSNRDVSTMSIKEMKRELTFYKINTLSFVEKSELVNALIEARLEAKPKADTKPVLHQNLIDEIPVDTTPRKSMVSKILGGDFTFLGQYEDEGIMIMIRRPVDDWDETTNNSSMPPINPHELQPPFENVEVRGDILLMRVAETEEELDYDEAIEKDDKNESESVAKKGNPKSEIHVPTNDEFFLDYTKEEYLKFAARTDIVAPEMESSSDEEEGEEQSDDDDDDNANKPSSATAKLLNNPDQDDDSDDEDFDPDEEGEDIDSEEHQVGMMNMILGHMLRKFREENGRGPDSLELLEMRKALADRLGVEVPPVDEEACDWDKKVETPGKGKKRGRKVVVVAEEMNKTEEIPRRDDDGDEFDEVDVEDHANGGDLASLERPAQEDDNANDEQDDDDEQQGSNKKAKLSTDQEEGGEES